MTRVSTQSIRLMRLVICSDKSRKERKGWTCNQYRPRPRPRFRFRFRFRSHSRFHAQSHAHRDIYIYIYIYLYIYHHHHHQHLQLDHQPQPATPNQVRLLHSPSSVSVHGRYRNGARTKLQQAFCSRLHVHGLLKGLTQGTDRYRNYRTVCRI